MKKTVLALVGAAALSGANAAHADVFGSQEIQRWDMCNWDAIPDHVLRKISRRDDFDDILRRMFDHCPLAAEGFADRPTASIAADAFAGERINGDDPEPPGPGGPTGPESEPDPDPDPGPDPDPEPEQPDFGLPG